MEIVRPITDDGLVGFSREGALIHCRKDAEYSTYTGIHDVRRQICIICNHGWQETAASLGDQSRWRLTETYVHRSCLIRHEGLVERQEFQSAVSLANFRYHEMVTLPNGYWAGSDPWSAKPWYQIELQDHPVKIILGARKRVLVIDVRPQGGTSLEWAKKAEEAFKDETVTKEFCEQQVMLHAWGAEKLRTYLKQICDIAGYGANP